MSEDDKKRDKIRKVISVVSPLYILSCCVFFYYTKFGAIWNYRFPLAEVLKSIPISFAVWLMCAIGDPEKYKDRYSFFACMVFGCTALTAMFLMFK